MDGERVLELLVFYLQVIWLSFKSFILLFVPDSWRAKDVTGQRVLITGAGSGLGKLMSLRFAELGCSLVLWDIDEASNELTAEEVRRFGVSAHPYKCDLSKREEIYAVADKVKHEVGEIDILVNNAGIVTGKMLLQCPDALIEKTMDVNINAHFWTTKAFLPSMLERNHGHIVTIASAAGLFGVTTLIDYCASKHAAKGFHESLTAELYKLGKDGVKTTVVCPTFISTGMFEGVTTKSEKLMPIITPEYAVQKIVNAVLVNQHMVCFPRIVYVLNFLQGLLPPRIALLAGQVTGANNSMDNFVGRQKRE